VSSPINREMPMPATLARMSTRPYRPTTVATAAAHASASRTSQMMPSGDSTTSQPTTSAPSVARRCATAHPMPLAAPDTKATVPSSRPMTRT
jgi:hypothetical protein